MPAAIGIKFFSMGPYPCSLDRMVWLYVRARLTSSENKCACDADAQALVYDAEFLCGNMCHFIEYGAG